MSRVNLHDYRNRGVSRPCKGLSITLLSSTLCYLSPFVKIIYTSGLQWRHFLAFSIRGVKNSTNNEIKARFWTISRNDDVDENGWRVWFYEWAYNAYQRAISVDIIPTSPAWSLLITRILFTYDSVIFCSWEEKIVLYKDKNTIIKSHQL